MTELPVAGRAEIRGHVRQVLRRHCGDLAVMLLLHCLAVACGLTIPPLVGELIEKLSQREGNVEGTAALMAVAVIVQALLFGLAFKASARLGEVILADFREEFVHGVLALPLATVEKAGSGDLVTRSTRDVDLLSRAVRHAAPEIVAAGATIVLTFGALALTAPLLLLPCFASLPVLWAATKWYLNRAGDGYLRQNASYSQLTECFTESVVGARTVAALGRQGDRYERLLGDLRQAFQAERYTLRLRTIYLPVSDVSYVLPVVATMVVGGLLHINGAMSLAAATAATLYVQQLLTPVDTMLFWLNELQIGGAALARLRGVSSPEEGRSAERDHTRRTHATSSGRTSVPSRVLAVTDVGFQYRPGCPVLLDVNLVVEPGERLAVVGPSGAGKSTLGRLMAGIHKPTSGSVTLGDVPLYEMPLTQLRREVSLVTQEHHVFRGTLRENLRLADGRAGDDELELALKAVDAWEWAATGGLDARIGVDIVLSPSQAQQLGLARIVLVDPQILILDEATSLMDPRVARESERSLAALLRGRTVVAIAHRLHTAHDADRIVVMDEGRIRELGTHDDLLRTGGTYENLWRSWSTGER